MGIYTRILQNSITGIYRTNAANKILQFINRIRNESDVNQARRFLIELMQNARDLAYKMPDDSRKPVSIRIRMSDTELEFSHNGKVFSVKDILSIIYQVSSKKPGEGIGQFGTGFMSTYQLSEVIDLTSYLKDGENPYLPFSITLDRSGRDKEAILDGIECTMQQLMESDGEAGISDEEFDPSAYNTRFLYHLEQERSREVARIGMEDLDHTILYTLLFSPQIEKVELIYETSSRKEQIVYTNGKPEALEHGLQSMTFLQGEQRRTLVYQAAGEGAEQITVVCECSGNRLLPAKEQTSKLYIDFPLIGSESFPFPTVINCRALHPNEPRSGISLVDNPNSLDAICNKEIMKQAVVLYGQFLHNLVEQDFSGLEHAIAMPVYPGNKEWSEQWVRAKLYHGCLKQISREPIFPTKNGKVCFTRPELRLIRAGQAVQRAAVQKLAEPLNGILVPTDDTDWDRALEGYQIESNRWISLERILNAAESLVKGWLDTEKQDAVSWIGQLYCSVMEDPDLADAVMAGKYAVFPDQESVQTGVFSLKRFGEVKTDPAIPECLKQAAMYLDCFYEKEERLEICSGLLQLDFPVQKDRAPEPYEVERLISYLSGHAELKQNPGYSSETFQSYRNRFWKSMIACGPDETMKKIAELFWKTEIESVAEAGNDERFPDAMWTSTYRSVLSVIAAWIRRCGTLRMLCETLEREEAEVIDWLNWFYESASKYLYLHKLKEDSIVLNQAGKFCYAAWLQEDRIEEELRVIAGVMYRKTELSELQDLLVDKRIVLPHWEMQTMGNGSAALQINKAVQALLAEKSLSLAKEEYQEACTRLLGWLGDHEKEAASLFPAFSKEEDRMKLLTTRAAVQLNHKAKELQNLLSEHGVESVEELKQVLRAVRTQPAGEEPSYDEASDVDFASDPFLLALSAAERDKRLRQIGLTGEAYVNGQLIEALQAQGYVIQQQDEELCCLSDGQGNTAEVCRPDHGDYHQAGWDIKVHKTSAADENGLCAEQIDFYEVKTCTASSIYRKYLRISNEQMVKAAAAGDYYHLVKVICDPKKLQVLESRHYGNLLQNLGERTLKNAEKGYLWKEV